MLKGPGTARLFQVSGISVFIHWTWLLVAIFEITGRADAYSSFAWNVLEYVALFGIVTLHEFGHAFACRSVGGRANDILLWPFGGIAFVDPPPRPGAMLWSIAAGPLVNVALLPIFGALTLLVPAAGWPNVHAFLRSLTFINLGLLLFNLLPVYPLDGGQILGALLWFVIGRTRSMIVAAFIGLAGVAGLGWLALSTLSLWLGFIAMFVAAQCLHSIRLARVLNSMTTGTGRTGVACPSCRAAAPIGPYWRCDSCGIAFDVFDPAGGPAPETAGATTLGLSGGTAPVQAADTDGLRCPACHADAATARCQNCHTVSSVTDWRPTAIISSLPSVNQSMTRFKAPRIPSVRPIVLSVCAAIVALMSMFVAIFTHTGASNEVDAAAALFMRQFATVVAVLTFVPAILSIWFFARYRRTQRAFELDLQRFQNEQSRNSQGPILRVAGP